MFALRVEFLTGRYTATAYNDRHRAEWPPHPARLYSALVASWGEGPEGEREPAAVALRWLAAQEAPLIYASAVDDVARRTVTPVFVPVNDVGVVLARESEKLEAARASWAATEPGDRAALAKAIEKLERQLPAATLKAIAVPVRAGKGDADAGRRVMPEGRLRQPRTFPSVVPADDVVVFAWDVTATPDVAESLSRLAARLVRLGHSSSLVHARAASEEEVREAAARLACYREDADAGRHVIRWVGPQQLDELQEAFKLHRETEPRVLPAVFLRYDDAPLRPAAEIPASVFSGETIVFARVGGPRLPITAIAGVARQLRRALMGAATEPIPPLLSGHDADGAPARSPHVAVVPLPAVGGPHADGALLGIALWLPTEADRAARRAVFAAVGRLELAHAERGDDDPPVIPLRLGAAGCLELQRVAWGDDPRVTLRPRRWTGPARAWLTATPVALDANPGALDDRDPGRRRAAFEAAARTVADGVERIGLPRPAAVEVHRSCLVTGSAKPAAYPRFPADPAKTQRLLVHARLTFDAPVRGPLLVGAGRFQGLGLFLPSDAAGDDA